ncbi:MAG: hypothetical protein L6420_08305 [Elusimicrobia bacterium]|nr:hypothetical protein [Candidatus Omnitrophota bacterium]MCG2726234.1 hypothetical protein [Elusimicrobiota bacterium]
MTKKELERICFNCNNFFPLQPDKPGEFGICLNDKEFEPFIDELLEKCDYTRCQELIERKRFSGGQKTCLDFSEIEDIIYVEGKSEFTRKLISLMENGGFSKEKLEELIIEEQVSNIDFKTLPVDKYKKQLDASMPEERNTAISSLGCLVSQGNKKAFQVLFEYIKQLSPPKTIEETHLKKEILSHLEYSDFRNTVIPYLIDELNRTPSNNTTRQWISDIIKFLGDSRDKKAHEHLKKLLKDKRFSYRIKRRVKEIFNSVSEGA